MPSPYRIEEIGLNVARVYESGTFLCATPTREAAERIVQAFTFVDAFRNHQGVVRSKELQRFSGLISAIANTTGRQS